MPVDNSPSTTPTTSRGERPEVVAESDQGWSRRATRGSSGERPYPLEEPLAEPVDDPGRASVPPATASTGRCVRGLQHNYDPQSKHCLNGCGGRQSGWQGPVRNAWDRCAGLDYTEPRRRDDS